MYGGYDVVESRIRIGKFILNIACFYESILRMRDDLSSHMDLRDGLMFGPKEESTYALHYSETCSIRSH